MADEIDYRFSCEIMEALAFATGRPPLDEWLWHRHEHRSGDTPYCWPCRDDVFPRSIFMPALALTVLQSPHLAEKAAAYELELVRPETRNIAWYEATAALRRAGLLAIVEAVAARVRYARAPVPPVIASPSHQPPPGAFVSRGLYGGHGPWCKGVPVHGISSCSRALSSWLYSVSLADEPDMRRRFLAASLDDPAPLGYKDDQISRSLFREATEIGAHVVETLSRNHVHHQGPPPPLVDKTDYLEYKLVESCSFLDAIIYAARSSRQIIPELLEALRPYQHDPVQTLYCAVNDVSRLTNDLVHGDSNYFSVCAAPPVDIGVVCDYISAAMHECAEFYHASSHKRYAQFIISALFQQVIDPRYAVALNSRASVNKFVLKCENGCSATSLCASVVRWLGLGETDRELQEVLGEAHAAVETICPELLPIIYGQGDWPYEGLQALARVNFAKYWLRLSSNAFVLSLLSTEGALGKVATVVPFILWQQSFPVSRQAVTFVARKEG